VVRYTTSTTDFAAGADSCRTILQIASGHITRHAVSEGRASPTAWRRSANFLTSNAGSVYEVWSSRWKGNSLQEAYERNEPLLAVMRPLGKRKEDFRDTFVRTMTAYRHELSNGAVLRIIHKRFYILKTSPVQSQSADAIFESANGERFAIASANDRTVPLFWPYSHSGVRCSRKPRATRI
jgi:hypothetical protein